MLTCSVRLLPSESYQFTLCDEQTPQIRCITCHQNVSGGSLRIATGGQQLKLWTESTTDSDQPTYAMHYCIHILYSGKALLLHHKPKWFFHLVAKGLSKGDEQPTYSPLWGMVLFTLRRLAVKGKFPSAARDIASEIWCSSGFYEGILSKLFCALLCTKLVHNNVHTTVSSRYISVFVIVRF